jgi:hypothetical protein
VTDRGIAIHDVAEGKESDTKVRDIMTEQIKYCFEDHVSKNMLDIQMRRLPVMNRQND